MLIYEIDSHIETRWASSTSKVVFLMDFGLGPSPYQFTFARTPHTPQATARKFFQCNELRASVPGQQNASSRPYGLHTPQLSTATVHRARRLVGSTHSRNTPTRTPSIPTFFTASRTYLGLVMVVFDILRGLVEHR